MDQQKLLSALLIANLTQAQGEKQRPNYGMDWYVHHLPEAWRRVRSVGIEEVARIHEEQGLSDEQDLIEIYRDLRTRSGIKTIEDVGDRFRIDMTFDEILETAGSIITEWQTVPKVEREYLSRKEK